MHYPTNRTVHTTTFVKTVVERETAQWVPVTPRADALQRNAEIFILINVGVNSEDLPQTLIVMASTK